jgi:TolA-binding protein
MRCGNEEHSGIMVNMSRGAGTCVGKVAAAGKKITGVVTGGATAVGHLLSRPVDTPELVAAEQTEPMSDGFALGARGGQNTEQGISAESLISTLESDLAAVRHELQEMQSKAEKTQSQIELQLSKLQSEKDSLLAELEQARSQANEAALQASEAKTQAAVLEILETNLAAVEQHNLENSRKEDRDIKPQQPFEMSPAQKEQEVGLPKPVEEVVVGATREKSDSSTETAVADITEDVSLKIEEQPSQVVSDVEMPGPLAVTDEQVQAAVFSKATDKILFAKAVSDMANQDVVVRLDAVKIIADIGHELSIKALAAQMASERSTQVRQECIKSLATLGMKEGLPAIENALADESGLVRLAAVWGLYRLAGKQSGTALAGMLSDKDEEVRRRAATCIGWLRQGRFAADLTILLDDDSVLVRQSAAEAMGNLGNERVVLSLVEHLKDPDKATRKIVLCAIEKITGKKMGNSLPKNEEDIGHLISRWRQWWKKDMLK